MPKSFADLDDLECRLEGLVSMGFAISDAKQYAPNAPDTYDPAADLLIDLLFFLHRDFKEVMDAIYAERKLKGQQNIK